MGQKRSKKTCQHCDKPSIPGLMKGVGLCQYHYNRRMFGEEWADYVESLKGDPSCTQTTQMS